MIKDQNSKSRYEKSADFVKMERNEDINSNDAMSERKKKKRKRQTDIRGQRMTGTQASA